MPWFCDQYIALVQVEDAVTEAIADTGGVRFLIELLLALDMGLPVQKAVGSEMGTYYGPGGVERAYTGCMVGPVRLWFGMKVVVTLPEIKVITLPEPFFLLGADVLCGGRKGWNFRSVGVGSDGQGLLTFAFRDDNDDKGKDRRTCMVALLNAPHTGNAPNYAPPEPTTLRTARAT